MTYEGRGRVATANKRKAALIHIIARFKRLIRMPKVGLRYEIEFASVFVRSRREGSGNGLNVPALFGAEGEKLKAVTGIYPIAHCRPHLYL